MMVCVDGVREDELSQPNTCLLAEEWPSSVRAGDPPTPPDPNRYKRLRIPVFFFGIDTRTTFDCFGAAL